MMCEWKAKHRWLGRYQCEVPPEEGSRYCIFHGPDEKNLEKFKKKFYEQIDEVGPEDKRNPRYDFTGYVFPAGLAVGQSEQRATTRSVVLPKEIPAGACFPDAVFEEVADFTAARFKGIAAFSHATFKDYALFKDTTFERDAGLIGGNCGRYGYTSL